MKKIIVLLFALVLLVGCTDDPVMKTHWKLTYSIHLPDTTIVKAVDFENGDQYGRAWISVSRKGASNTVYVRPRRLYCLDYPVETSLCPIVIESFEAIKP